MRIFRVVDELRPLFGPLSWWKKHINKPCIYSDHQLKYQALAYHTSLRDIFIHRPKMTRDLVYLTGSSNLFPGYTQTEQGSRKTYSWSVSTNLFMALLVSSKPRRELKRFVTINELLPLLTALKLDLWRGILYDVPMNMFKLKETAH